MAVVGVLVVVGTALAYLILTFGLRRTYPTWWFDLGVVTGTTIGVLGWLAGGSAWAALAAMALEVAWLGLTRLEMRLTGSDQLTVGVGDPIPPFTARITTGEPFTERDLAANGPALLVLYRGWWCPYCTTQLDELAASHRALGEAGVTTYAISVDTPQETAALQERYGEAVSFLSDPQGAFLDRLGVRDSRGAAWYDRLIFGARKQDISIPGALVIDDEGRIVFAYRSPRIDIRVRPEVIIDALR